jgi:ABC-2 type transport system permease protein
MNNLRLLLLQIRYTNKAFWRNPAAAFFTFAFPLMFLVIFTSLLGNGHVHVPGKIVSQSTYYVAAMATFSVITACYTNVAMNLTFQRDLGILKRTRGTPLPATVYLGARVLHALLIGVLLDVITVAFGRFFYHAQVPTGLTLLRFVVALLVGSATFAALAFAISGLIPNATAGPAIVNASILPLLFVSGVFIPTGVNSPAWITWIAKIFPVAHFAQAMEAGFLGIKFNWHDILVLALWGVGGLIAAVRLFSWEPRT